MEHLYNMQTCYADVQTETFQLFSIAMYITMLSQLKGNVKNRPLLLISRRISYQK